MPLMSAEKSSISVAVWCDREMNFLISILYAPLVFYSFRHFDIQTTSIIVFSVSIVWFLVSLNYGKKQALYPLLYIIISSMAYLLKDFNILKVLPLLVSSFITLFIAVSYIRNNSVILYFAKKFARHEISPLEQEYIHKSTLFWIGVSLLNVIIHLYIFLGDNIDYWIYYSSFGWYLLFLMAGLLQFLHRRYVFTGGMHSV